MGEDERNLKVWIRALVAAWLQGDISDAVFERELIKAIGEQVDFPGTVEAFVSKYLKDGGWLVADGDEFYIAPTLYRNGDYRQSNPFKRCDRYVNLAGRRFHIQHNRMHGLTERDYEYPIQSGRVLRKWRDREEKIYGDALDYARRKRGGGTRHTRGGEDSRPNYSGLKMPIEPDAGKMYRLKMFYFERCMDAKPVPTWPVKRGGDYRTTYREDIYQAHIIPKLLNHYAEIAAMATNAGSFYRAQGKADGEEGEGSFNAEQATPGSTINTIYYDLTAALEIVSREKKAETAALLLNLAGHSVRAIASGAGMSKSTVGRMVIDAREAVTKTLQGGIRKGLVNGPFPSNVKKVWDIRRQSVPLKGEGHIQNFTLPMIYDFSTLDRLYARIPNGQAFRGVGGKPPGCRSSGQGSEAAFRPGVLEHRFAMPRHGAGGNMNVAINVSPAPGPPPITRGPGGLYRGGDDGLDKVGPVTN